MLKNFLVSKKLAGEPSGFAVAVLLAFVGLISAFFVAVELRSITSFSDIAWTSLLSMVSLGSGALVALFTVRHAHDD